MEIEVLSKTKDSIEFRLKGERHTFPQLLRNALLKDSKVEFAAYKLEHPHDTDSFFALKTDGKDPKKALEEACKTLDEELEEFKKEVKKQLK